MRSLTATLVLVLVVCLAATASAKPIEADRASWQEAAAAPQSPVMVDAHWRADAAPQSPIVADAHWRAPAATDVAATPADVLPSPDGGLSAFLIVLICAGGVLLLGAAALTGTRVVAHRATH